MKLTGQQCKQLQKALIRAFPDRSRLAQLVRFKLEQDLDTIARNDNLANTAFELIQWAESEGRVKDLVNGACNENPGNPDLQAFAQTLEAAATEASTDAGDATVQPSVIEHVRPEQQKVLDKAAPKNDSSTHYNPVFTPDERDENEGHKDELIELVTSGEAVLIVGAGSSRRVGYDTWSSLLQKMEELACDCGDGFTVDENARQNAPLEYAETIKIHIDERTGNLDQYKSLLYDLFKRKTETPPCDDFHRTLVSLPVRGILTTNYDPVLEAALGEKDPTAAFDNSLVIGSGSASRVNEFLMAMNNDSRITRRIAHLHGKFEPSDSIILSAGDYEKAYGSGLQPRPPGKDGYTESSWTLHRKLLWAVLATRRTVFIGFSMNDPYLNKMLEIVSHDFWRWDKSVHFALMGISPKDAEESKNRAAKLKREYGVSVVFYENPDGFHRGLEQLIAEIAEACNVDTSFSVPSERETSDEKLPSDPVTPTSDTDEAKRASDWLEMVNQKMESE
jgi:hypothetical protein